MNRRRHAQRVRVDAIDAVELAALANNAGFNVLGTVRLLADVELAGAPLFRQALARFDGGEPLIDALTAVTSPDDPLRPLIDAWAAADRYGTALGPVLDRLAERGHDDRRRLAEVAARRVPVLLLFPLVCCVLPAVALVTVVPLIIGALRGLVQP